MVDNVSMPPESFMVETDESIEATESRDYFIDPATAEESQRSLSVLVSSRQCYMCQKGLPEDENVALAPQEIIDQISAHCSQGQDFLLPDTPMKEAVFRVLLAGGNEPMDAQAIGMALSREVGFDTVPERHLSESHPATARQQRLLLHCPRPRPGGPRRGVAHQPA